MTEGTDTPNPPTLGNQRKLEVTVAPTGGPDGLSGFHDAAKVVELSFRIPDDMDLATLDQVGAKITKSAAGIIDAAISVSGLGQLTRTIRTFASALAPDGVPIEGKDDQKDTDEVTIEVEREFAEV